MAKAHFLFLLLAALLGSTSVRAQDIKLHKQRIEPSVHGRYFDPPKYDSFFFGLPDVRYSDFQRHARLAFRGCIVDLYQAEGMPTSGTVIYHIDQRPKRSNSKKLGSNLSYSQVIDTETSACLLDYLLNTPFDTFQNDTLVSPSLDSLYREFGSVLLETKTDTGYQKSYSSRWTYSFTKDIDISLAILNYGPVTKQLQVKTSIKVLEGLLSDGRTYAYDGGSTYFYRFTKRQSRRWAKKEPHFTYMDSVKPVVDSFIVQTLRNTYESGYCELFVKFSKRGKVLRIKSRDNFWQEVFYKKLRRQRKTLRRIFRRFPISGIEPTKSYWKTISIDTDGDIWVGKRY